jgi:hypothetical protein
MDKEYKMIYSIPKLISLNNPPPLSEGQEACVTGPTGGQGACTTGDSASGGCTVGDLAGTSTCTNGQIVTS